MLKSIVRNLANLPGWRTNRKIVVIESDDWGTIRMSSKEAFNSLLNKGYPVDQCPYNKYDALESNQDLEMLFDQSYNFIKGAIIGYVRGQITLMDVGRQELLIDITDLKNSFAGLNTELMMGESAISDMSIKQKIVKCKFDYKK